MMFQFRLKQKVKPLIALRYVDEWVGFLVFLSIAICIGAVIEAGVLRDWLTPPARLRVILPSSGVGGLTVGGDVQFMGAHVGNIRSIKINPSGSMYAIVDLDPQTKPFVRRDSIALIRRQFIVAGASYLELIRGHGKPMNWSYAVITAKQAPDPTKEIIATLESIKAEVMPVLASARHMMAQLDSTITNMHEGKGTVGQLMTSDKLIRQAEQVMASLNDVINRIKPIEEQASGVMENVKAVSGDVRKTTPHLPKIAHNVEVSTGNLPALLTQAQVSLYELQKLIAQLRGLWFLGGQKSVSHNRLSPAEIQP